GAFSGPRWGGGLGGDAGGGTDGGLAEGLGRAHGGQVVVGGGPAAAGGVAVDLGHAVAGQLQGEGVGIPGGAGIAAMGVATPPGDAQGARQAVAVGPEDAGQLKQGGIAGGVVADADVPGVEVAVEQDELLGDAGTGDLGDEHGDGAPAGVEAGGQGHLGTRLGGGDQRLAVGVVDGHDGDGGLAAHRVEVGSAPDGGADALVDGL